MCEDLSLVFIDCDLLGGFTSTLLQEEIIPST